MKRFSTLLFLLSLCCSLTAQQLDKSVMLVKDQVIAWRRHIHQYPELSNREFKTAEYVTTHLKSLGLLVDTGVAKTGVVAVLRGDKPGPVIGLRADMDALPVLERHAIPYASKAKGEYNGEEVPVMHACGHDAHTAVLMGVADVLSKLKKDLSGTIVFVFQPAEEGPPAGEEGGAALMVKEGLLEKYKIDYMIALHMDALMPSGKLGYKSKSILAGSDLLNITIKGVQVHGASPWSGVDPIMVSAQVINGLQTIVSRQSDITKAPIIVSLGKIQGGVRANIIPETVTLEGTIRTLDPTMQKETKTKVEDMVKYIAKANNATAEVSVQSMALVTYNDEKLSKLMKLSMIKAVGESNVEDITWRTNAEDFSFFSDKVPSFYFFLGGLPEGKNSATAANHHSPDFFLDDSKLDVGVKTMCTMVLDLGAKYKSLSK